MESTAKNSESPQKKSFFKGLKAEFNKIVWTDREALTKQTVGVVAITVALGAVIAILDYGIKFGLDKLFLLG